MCYLSSLLLLLLSLGHVTALAKMQPAATDGEHLSMCVCVSVCWSQPQTLQKWLN